MARSSRPRAGRGRQYPCRVLHADPSAAKRTPPWRCTRSWLEFPEDLGRAALGVPASIWQRAELRALPDVERRAIFQCEVASVDYSKATGILTDIVGFFEEFPSHAGWPSFDPNWVYLGPLPQVCRHGGHPGLCGKTPDGEWKTGPTGSYPPEICKHMAVKAFADFCARACVRIQASTPADGDKERAGPLVMQLAGPKAVVDDWLGKAPQLPSSARDYVVGSSITVGLKFGGGARRSLTWDRVFPKNSSPHSTPWCPTPSPMRGCT